MRSCVRVRPTFDNGKFPLFAVTADDVADIFSTHIVLQFAPADAYNLIVGTAFVSAAEAQKWREERLKKPLDEAQREMVRRKIFANEHSLPQQRFFNLLCVAYGAEPKTFAAPIPVEMAIRF